MKALSLSCKFLAFSFVGLISFSSTANIDIIYGEDNRVEAHEAKKPWQKLAKSTAAMINTSKIRNRWFQKGVVKINGNSLGAELRLCKGERFADQLSAADCSGFLIGPDLLATAGHCMRDERCEENKWVFDYNTVTLNGGNSIPASKVYSCKKVVQFSFGAYSDYAVVQLDREVTDREPLKLRRSGTIKDKASLVVIGHPSGLPTKVSDGANLLINSDPEFFTANLDSFSGNSGSAVFNEATGLVEGILVRGAKDYVESRSGWGSCLKANVCKGSNCPYETVLRITELDMSKIPE